MRASGLVYRICPVSLSDAVNLKPEDTEAKNRILKLIIDKRPTLEAMKMELAARQEALNAGLE